MCKSNEELEKNVNGRAMSFIPIDNIHVMFNTFDWTVQTAVGGSSRQSNCAALCGRLCKGLPVSLRALEQFVVIHRYRCRILHVEMGMK